MIGVQASAPLSASSLSENETHVHQESDLVTVSRSGLAAALEVVLLDFFDASFSGDQALLEFQACWIASEAMKHANLEDCTSRQCPSHA